jgi:hypothetical protein
LVFESDLVREFLEAISRYDCHVPGVARPGRSKTQWKSDEGHTDAVISVHDRRTSIRSLLVLDMLMSTPELAGRLSIKMTWLYEQSRMKVLPGKVRGRESGVCG